MQYYLWFFKKLLFFHYVLIPLFTFLILFFFFLVSFARIYFISLDLTRTNVKFSWSSQYVYIFSHTNWFPFSVYLQRIQCIADSDSFVSQSFKYFLKGGKAKRNFSYFFCTTLQLCTWKAKEGPSSPLLICMSIMATWLQSECKFPHLWNGDNACQFPIGNYVPRSA